MTNVPYGEKTERRMQLLERAAEHAMPCIILRLVNKMAWHCALSVASWGAGGVRDLAVLLYTKSTLASTDCRHLDIAFLKILITGTRICFSLLLWPIPKWP
ncbi:hypothetical protein JG687_00011024 [Phytophthora cactorum]|uniref:Uncharacterized protein n=1 Tax=Phytophthora cactorum TaxID=29920 RepID=A0A8T1U5C3_9STRA|nr:hypothetical protein JG687_00011024 [Phytophthora cactorum]